MELTRKDDDAQKDMLSGLPDDVLLHILSFLGIKDAAKTSLLRRFGSLWRQIPVLDFDDCSYHICHNGPYRNHHLFSLIHQVIKLNASVILEKIRLKLHFHKGHGDSPLLLEELAAEINSLIHYALSKKVKVIDLDLLGCGLFELMEDYTVPDAVFRSDFLVELRLSYCEIQNREGEICLKSLKILYLCVVDLNDELMEKILAGCPSLQDLTVIGCSSLKMLNCKGSWSLKKLKLVLHMGKPLMISCPPNLVSFEMAGRVERVRLI